MAEDMECVAMLEICHVSKTYAGKKALQDVSFSLPQGELVGLEAP